MIDFSYIYSEGKYLLGKVVGPLLVASFIGMCSYIMYDTVKTVEELNAFLDQEIAYAESNREYFKSISEKYKREPLALATE